MKAKLIKQGAAPTPAPQPQPKPVTRPARPTSKPPVNPRAEFHALFKKPEGVKG
jgi:hypothetical protein